MSSDHNISSLPQRLNKKNKQKKKQNTPEDILNNIRTGATKSNDMSGASIYRVPKRLYNLNKKAYTPRLVSIGPLHCKDQHLKTPMQDIKKNYVHSFLVRMKAIPSSLELGDPDERKLELLINKMRELLPNARKYYAEEVDNELDEEMLVIDGCFILELLYKYHEEWRNDEIFKEWMSRYPNQPYVSQSSNTISQPEKSHPHDPISGSKLTFFTIQHDLLLLENQLPFSALNELFLLTKDLMPTSSMTSLASLSEYARFYFFKTTKLGPRVDTPKSVIVQVEKEESEKESKKESQKESEKKGKKDSDYFHILHILLDDFHSFEDGAYKPANEKNPVLEALVNILRPLQKFFSRLNGRDGHDDSGICPSASELVEAGVKLLKCTSFEIKFYEADSPFRWCCRACFEIPVLRIDDSAELFFRNLIAFEQCYPRIERRFTSYAALMDNLISTVKDVEVLENAGVITDYLGSRQEVVDLFNKLCKDVVVHQCFSETCRQATAYTKRFWPKAIAHLRRQYFATPWTTIAFAVALIVFGITVTKFIQSFLP